MNNTKFHGVTSLTLVAIASLIGLIVMARSSWMWSGIYLAVIITASQIILRTYCAKCPCKAHCGHIFPGKIASAFAKDGPYIRTDFLILGVSVLLLIGLPQFWLWHAPRMFVAYWILTGIALVQIRLVICPNCSNVYCPMRVKTQQQ